MQQAVRDALIVFMAAGPLDTLAPLGRRSTSAPHLPEGTQGGRGRRELDAQQANLVDDLAALNEARLCEPYGPIRERLDADTVADIKKIQAVAIAMKDNYGIPKPAFLRRWRWRSCAPCGAIASVNVERMPVP